MGRVNSISYERATELFHYDPETGLIRWIKKTSKYSRVTVGSIAGCPNSEGYRYIRVDGKLIKSHNIAWLIMTEVWPEFEVDHEDRDPSNNKWDNLRSATRSLQMANTRIRGDNTSGVRGVSYHNRIKKWYAYITLNGKTKSLGYRDTLEEASDLYDEKAQEYFGEFRCCRK